MEVTSGCLCRQVRYRITAAPIVTRVCWCRDCQYFAAGSATVNVCFPSNAVTIEGETGDYKGRCFCRRCGSSVFARTGDEIEVHIGSLDAPDHLMPTYESWIIRRESWLPPFPLKRRYERDREAKGRSEE